VALRFPSGAAVSQAGAIGSACGAEGGGVPVIAHRCMFDGCAVRVEAQRLTCVHHWRALPASVQAEIQVRRFSWRENGCKSTGAARDFLARWLRIHKGEVAR
jgi:hypothetical protein